MNDILLYLAPSKQNEELRYALRTWEKNLKFRNLYVVGGPIPNWFKPDIYQPNPLKYTKMRQCYDNLIVALKDDRLTEDVLLMMDDIFLIQPCGEWEINYNRGTLQEQLNRLDYQHHTTDSYLEMVHKTNELLCQDYESPLSFEEHLPFKCNRKKLLSILDQYGPQKMQHLLYRSIYGNRFSTPTEFRLDVKLKELSSPVLPHYTAFSTNGLSFRGNGGSYVKYHFPTPSHYEK